MNTHLRGHRHIYAAMLTVSVLLMQHAPVAAQSSFEMLPPLGDGRQGIGDYSQPRNTGTANDAMNPAANSANTAGAFFELRPHCESADFYTAFNKPPREGITPVAESTCPSYDVKDPLTLQTAELREGDSLDMDLIIRNPGSVPLERFRAWIAYDPTVMEGELIEISKAFPTPTPGENDFSVSDGMIKLSGTADVPQSASMLIVARIRLHMLPTTQSGIPMTFYDATGTPDSRTAIMGTGGTNVATTAPGSVMVRISPSAPAPAASSVPMSAMSASSASSALTQASVSSTGTQPPSSGIFDMLQVQQLKVTTEGSSVFLAWNKLPSAELVGYNLYYGTISGQYLQKRSVDKNSTNITIRALPEGVTYYFAVRGVDANNRETDFSQEVGISVGNPATSTAPLSASTINRAPNTPRTGGTVSGETGMTSTLILFVLLSAAIGTGLAFRRQLSAKV